MTEDGPLSIQNTVLLGRQEKLGEGIRREPSTAANEERGYNHEPRRSQRKQRERACKCRKTAYSRRFAIASGGLPEHEKARLFDGSIVGTAQEAVDFITNILESSTEYSVNAKDLTGKILLWNEGARRLYGYEPDEVVGKANSSILHAPQDIKAGVPAQIMQAALKQGKWEGTLTRQRKNGDQFTARVVITPRSDPAGKPIGFLLIAKDISDEIRLTQYARSLIEASVDPLVTISPERKITDVNEATMKVTGASREKLIGADFANYFTEPEKAREGYQRVFSEGFVTDYHRAGDGIHQISIPVDELSTHNRQSLIGGRSRWPSVLSSANKPSTICGA